MSSAPQSPTGTNPAAAARSDSGSGLVLLRGAEVFAPAALGRQDLLIAAGRIVQMADSLGSAPSSWGVEEIDLSGLALIPGLIDLHAHLTGGGGEAGFGSRVPRLEPSRFWGAGITTAVGLLGTDDVTRTPADLVAAVRDLRAQGLGAWCYTGGYHLPPVTLTGSVRSDLVQIGPMIGVGEVAISDHRSSQPTLDELLRVAADSHVAGLMTGKAGTLHLHVGDGARGLDLVRRALERSEIPARVFHPTHVNRRRALLDEAFELVERGCTVDVTAFPPLHRSISGGSKSSVEGSEEEVDAHSAVLEYLRAELPLERLTVSSDGGGCLPSFDHQGQVTHFDIGDPGELLRCLQRVVAAGIELPRALQPFTSNPAALLRLRGKGRIAVGTDADLVALDAEAELRHVWTAGVCCVREGEPVRRGRFEGA